MGSKQRKVDYPLQAKVGTQLRLHCDFPFVTGRNEMTLITCDSTGFWNPEPDTCLDNDPELENVAKSLRMAVKTSRMVEVAQIFPPNLDPSRRKYLVDSQASTTKGWTALMEAIVVGSLPMVQFLSQPQISPNLLLRDASPDSNTAFHLAVKKKRPDIVATLLQLDGRQVLARNNHLKTALNLAADLNDTNTALLLINNAAPDLNNADDMGRTALMSASSLNNLQIVSALAEKGANVTLRDKVGDMAVHIAAYYRYKDIVAFFFNHFPFLRNERDGYGNLPVCC